jgi:heat shock protein HslJ
MKKNIYLLVLSIVFYSCGSNSLQENSNEKISLFQEWIFNNSEKIYIKFDEKTKQISGFSGCNQFFGNFEKNSNSLKINSVGLTKMYCPEIKKEQNFINLLQQTTSYKIEQKKLYLYKENLELLTFNLK